MPKSWLKLGLPLGLALMVSLSACSSLLQVPSTVEVALAFPQEVPAGGVASGTLTVRASEFNGQVALRILSPEGFTLLSPTSITVSSGERQYPVQVRVGEAVSPGSYEVVVQVMPQGQTPREVRATLRVVAPRPPDFTLSLNPTSLSVQQGPAPRPPSPSLPKGASPGR